VDRERNEKQAELTPEEVNAQEAAELPDREAMSLVNANLAIPINAALAANVLSDGANAGAGAAQTTPIDQGAI
jgi:hypothetical protein